MNCLRLSDRFPQSIHPLQNLTLFLLLLTFGCQTTTTSAPSISRFEVTPAVIEVGEAATLTADYTHGQGQVDPGIGLLPAGTRLMLYPTQSTSYTLTVTSPGNSPRTARAGVTVKPGLLVQVEGLPQGLEAAITVTGPSGFAKVLTGTTALKGLTPGRYSIQAAQVMEGAIRRPPLRQYQEVDIADTGTQVTVRYPSPTLSFNLPGNVALVFVLIPPGSFQMGATHPEQTEGWEVYPTPETALPRHQVTIAKGFYLTTFPVTTQQWKAVTGWTTPDHASKDPEVAVWDQDWLTWQREFLPALKRLLPNQEFRMPSEAEWEYALRAGTTTRYFWGSDLAPLDTFCWTAETTLAVGVPWPRVGQKQPNPWGLHDMFTVRTWTEDDSHLNYLGAPTDGRPWLDSPRPIWRVSRGSTWSAPVRSVPHTGDPLQSAYRFVSSDPTVGAGLRLALDIPE